MVINLNPFLHDSFYLSEMIKNIAIQYFIATGLVKSFDVGILVQATRFDIVKYYSILRIDCFILGDNDNIKIPNGVADRSRRCTT